MSRTETITEELSRIDGYTPNQHSPSPKHVKMAANPFRFFRGSASLFYRDLADNTLHLPAHLSQHPTLTTVIGDCHLSNFGFITEEGSSSNKVIFTPNDFDDACIGKPVWDLARFCVSIRLAADYGQGLLDGRYKNTEQVDLEMLSALSDNDCHAAIHSFLAGYLHTMVSIIEDDGYRNTTVSHFAAGHVLNKAYQKALRRAPDGKDFLAKSALAKAIDLSNGRPKFIYQPDKYRRIDNMRYEQLEYHFRPYCDDDILDIVERIGAGTGSVNMKRYYLLVGPLDYQDETDVPLCHIVEIKQQRAAAPLHQFSLLSPVNRLSPAHLTLDCQRRMQRRSDLVLDEVEFEDKHWLVRSRHHARVNVALEKIVLAKRNVSEKFSQYTEACGQALARAHSRGDRRSTRLEQHMLKILPNCTNELIAKCDDYAELCMQDWTLLRQQLGLK